MPIPILMPALSPTMEEGTLAKWHVKEGDKVASGDVIAEIETDKATMEVEAVDEGTVGKLLVSEGTAGVPVNKLIALLLEEGEDASALPASHHDADPAPAAKSDRPERGGMEAPPDSASSSTGTGVAAPPGAAGGAPGATSAPAPAETAPPSPTNGQSGRIFASPLARRIAKERGIDLMALTGSGPRGRIVKHDVESAKPEPGSSAEPVARSERKRDIVRAGPQAPPTQAVVPALTDEQIFAFYEPGSYDLVPHDTMRKTVAKRLTQAKATIPHFYLSIDCEIDALLSARTLLNALAPKDGPRAFKLSVNDFIIKALAMALQKAPAANATWTEQGILRHRTSDLAVAVALEGGGLFTPVIRHAEVKSLSEISNEMKDLAHRARSKRLAPHEYQGGATAISNLGMYGIRRFDAVINPPQASILAVGAGEKRPVIRDGEIKVATMMSVTLSVDHRVIDGALGAELLAAFKGFVEDPVTMLA